MKDYESVRILPFPYKGADTEVNGVSMIAESVPHRHICRVRDIGARAHIVLTPVILGTTRGTGRRAGTSLLIGLNPQICERTFLGIVGQDKVSPEMSKINHPKESMTMIVIDKSLITVGHHLDIEIESGAFHPLTYRGECHPNSTEVLVHMHHQKLLAPTNQRPKLI